MSNVLSLEDYDVATSPHTYFLMDTCVLIDIFLPDPQRPQRTKAHQSLFLDLLKKKKTLLFSSYQIMEFEKVFMSIYLTYFKNNHKGQEFLGKKVGNLTQKEFRQLPDFQKAKENFFFHFNRELLPFSYVVPDIFDFDQLDTYKDALQYLDFHDVLYCALSQKYDAPIVTHDRDFFSSPEDVTIISLLKPI